MEYVGGYFLLLDMTRSSIGEFRKAGLSWCICKSADEFLPVSKFIEIGSIRDPHDLELELKINGKTRQKANTNQMNFKIPDMISYVSRYMTLHEGDLFLTGTPDGIGSVINGDQLEATLKQNNEELARLNLKINITKST